MEVTSLKFCAPMCGGCRCEAIFYCSNCRLLHCAVCSNNHSLSEGIAHKIVPISNNLPVKLCVDHWITLLDNIQDSNKFHTNAPDCHCVLCNENQPVMNDSNRSGNTVDKSASGTVSKASNNFVE